VLGDGAAALEVVAADGHVRLVGQHRAPAHRLRALLHQRGELVAIGEVIAVAEQDDAVGLLAVGVVGVPVTRELLERDQQVVAVLRAGAGDRAEHRKKKRIDVRIVGGGIFKDQQRQRAGVLGAQVRGVLVDLVVELLDRRLDAPARLLVDQRAAAQRARHRGLRDAGQVGDIQRGDFSLGRHDAVRLLLDEGLRAAQAGALES
jgi:hypothetical protein